MLIEEVSARANGRMIGMEGWCQFSRSIQASKFSISDNDASGYMRVAALYADRPDITGKAAWHFFEQLASPTLVADIRNDFEKRIAAGERVTASAVIAQRRAHPLTPKGRWPERQRSALAI